jgi:hypothetical protein
MAPMPMSPAVDPMVPVPAVAAALGDQLDRRRTVKRGLARRVVGQGRPFEVRQVGGLTRWPRSERDAASSPGQQQHR